jgi:hypothetical protein
MVKFLILSLFHFHLTLMAQFFVMNVHLYVIHVIIDSNGDNHEQNPFHAFYSESHRATPCMCFSTD